MKKKIIAVWMVAGAGTLGGCGPNDQNREKPEAYLADGLQGERFAMDEEGLERALKKSLLDESAGKLSDSDEEAAIGAILIARKLDRLIEQQTEQSRLLAAQAVANSHRMVCPCQTLTDEHPLIRLGRERSPR